MDRQARTAKRDLECMFFDESMEAKPLPLSLLNCITDYFSNHNEIGRGGFAVVYKGLLENGAVAVKKLSQTSDIDERKFHGEVGCLMKAKHKNIVRFLGYCSDTQGQQVKLNGKSIMAEVRQRLLCFEYLPNGSLDKYIKDASLEWGRCYQIIKGVCKGLHYLHIKKIVHSDLKPANILLDDDMVPKITDFGHSRCFDGNQTHVVTSKVVGTLGYFAPEYFNGKISFKSDIYSLGVIIIEILTGEKGYPNVDKVLECWRHKVAISQKEQQLEQIRVCTEVAQSCFEPDPVKRPYAQGIIDILEQTESKERCIETSSLVENKNKHNHPRIDPGTVTKAVIQAISELYAQGTTDMSFKKLHRDAYDVVLHENGEELYSAVETALTSGVRSLRKPLDTAQAGDELFLQELLAKWNRHVRAVKMTRYMLMCMERAFVPTNRKMPIYKLGLRLWCDHLANSDTIRERLIEAVLQRGGEDKLVAGVNEMMIELGAEPEPDGKLRIAGEELPVAAWRT